MIRKLPILVLAVIVAMSCTMAYNTKGSAASPIFYEGTAEFALARRSWLDTVDFNYVADQVPVPYYSTVATINSEKWGMPSAFSDTTYTRVPMYVAVNCPDVAYNGGMITISFVIGWFQGNGLSITNFQPAQVSARAVYQYNPGSFDRAKVSGISGTATYAQSYPNAVTTMINPYPQTTGNERMHVRELNNPNGINYPSIALFDLSDSEGSLVAYGMQDNYFLGFNESADDTWRKSNVFTFTFTVSGNNIVPAGDRRTCFYFDFSDLIVGSFTPVEFSNYTLQTNAGVYYIQSALSGSKSNLMYLCPISAVCTSSGSYSSIEQYLANIVNDLSSFTGQGVSQSVLESYAALGSEAREAAASAASAMAQAYPTYDPSAMDVSNLMDPTAKQQFKNIVSFLGNQKILPILGAVFTLCLIAFVFFGKK